MALTNGASRLDHDADLAGAALAVARRFAAGATMWCLAPRWPEHARHVAVEFVHPVIMGKRALPSVSVDGANATAQLRSSARPGDVLLAVAAADDPVVQDVVRRSEAWGLLTVWIGAGPTPPQGSCDFALWASDSSPLARHDGSMVLAYHVLWELVHVCFEHPGLLTSQPIADQGVEECAIDGSCITCSDEGRIGEVAAVVGPGLASVRTAQGVEEVDTTLVEPVAAGSLVLVHAGVAISLVEALQ